MSRQLDGVDDRLVFGIAAALQSYTFGTWLFLIRMLADGSWSGIINLHNSALTSALAGIEKGDTANDNRLNLSHGASSRKNPDAITVSDNWLMCIVGKATGTVTPTWSLRTDGTGGSWTHGSMDGTLANATGTSARMVVGEWEGTDHANMRVSAQAIWQGTDLSNPQRESIWPGGSSGSVQNIIDLTPTHAWQYNQAAVGDGVPDLMANGGDEIGASRVGTAINADEPSGWSYLVASALRPTPIVAPALAVVRASTW